MKIAPKYIGLFTMLFIASGMSFVMSLTMTAINVGFTSSFIFAWLRSWLISSLVAFPAASVMIPFVRKMVSRLTA